MKFHARSRVAALAFLSTLVFLAGCGKFFPPVTSGGGGSGTTTSGDYFYAGSLQSGSPAVAGLSVGNSTIAAISGSPWGSSIGPEALAIDPNNNYVYVGGGSAYEVDSWAIDGSTGALSAVNALGSFGPVALQVDNSGSWLVGMDSLQSEIYAFALTSGGGISSPYSSSIAALSGCDPSTDLSGLPAGLVISSSDYIYASCGTAGIYVLSLNASTGAVSLLQTISPKKSGAADSGLALATTTAGSYLIAAETVTSGARVFSISSTNGKLTELSSSPVSTGAGPDAVLVDSSDSYVYVANRTDGTISGFLLSNSGALTAISGSPFTTGLLPVALAEDNSGTYIAVACSGSNDIDTYTIGASPAGALTSYNNFSVNTPASLVATH